MTTVGVLAPGAMGAALGACLRSAGQRVVTDLTGRSAVTAARAVVAGLEDLRSVDAVVADADVVLSVVPPAQAVVLADVVAGALRRTGARPLVADLNATSPSKMSRVADALPTDVVDGAVSGSPPTPSGAPTRIFLAGDRAAELAELEVPGVRWVVLDGPSGTASAAKMCTASVRKGHQALLANALLTAEHFGVLDTVLADLRIDFPDDGVGPAAVAATKAWRFVDEMEEIVATQAAAGLTPALFTAAAGVYRDLATSRFGSLRPDELPASPEVGGLRPRSIGEDAP